MFNLPLKDPLSPDLSAYLQLSPIFSSSSSSNSMEEMVLGELYFTPDQLLYPHPLDLSVSNPPNLYYRPITCPISPDDMEQLKAMRIASGWYYERIPSWINEIATGQRLMWFIYLSDPMSQVLATAANSAYASHHHSQSQYPQFLDSGSSSSSSSASRSTALYSATASTSAFSPMAHPPVGMVCLSLNNDQDPSLASFSQSGRCEICSLFVYAAYRSLGVGAAAMRNMEDRARMLGAIFVTLNTPAIERPLRKYLSMGYREYKPRCRVYSSNDVRGAGLPEEYEVAAFLEKSLTT